MRENRLAGLIIIMALPAVLFLDWCSFRDRMDFFPPVAYEGAVPIRNDAYGEGHFGARRSGGRTHKGIDISAPVGAPVRAARGGIAIAGNQPGGMGKYFIIRHSGPQETLYGHLSSWEIADGTRVRQGTLIGRVGKTGNADHPRILPHLHFEVRENGSHRDPLTYLAGNGTAKSD